MVILLLLLTRAQLNQPVQLLVIDRFFVGCLLMARNIGSVATFEKSVADWIDRAESGFEIVVANTVTKTANAIVDLSPVDTGRFKANWQITANSPAQQSLNEYDQTGWQTKTY